MKITRNHIAIAITAIGMLQMVGHTLRVPALRGIGLATGVAPFPRVFCETDGYEAFAASYHLRWTMPDGTRHCRQITPEWYADLAGPYNRRNAYGAAIAFAPRMDPALRDAVLNHAMAPDSPLRRELGIPPEATDPAIHIIPRSGEADGPWTFTSTTNPSLP